MHTHTQTQTSAQTPLLLAPIYVCLHNTLALATIYPKTHIRAHTTFQPIVWAWVCRGTYIYHIYIWVKHSIFYETLRILLL